MEITFTGRHQEMTENIKEYFSEKLEKVVKNIPKVGGIHVIVDLERFQYKVEVVVHASHADIRAAQKTDDLMASFDKVMDKLQRQLNKYKEKLQYHRTKEEKMPKSELPSMEEEVRKPPKLIRVKKFEPKPMDASEALMQLKLSDDDFLVFLNADTELVNVIYKLKDGNFGLIEPETGKA